jgi:hypothetical protein
VVERAIGPLDQSVGVVDGLGERGDPDADRDRSVRPGVPLDGRPHPFGGDPTAAGVGGWQEDDELLAAVAGNEVVVGGPQRDRDSAQHVVAALVAEGALYVLNSSTSSMATESGCR